MIAGGETTGENGLNEECVPTGTREAERPFLAPFQGAVRLAWTFSGGCTTG